MNHSKRSNGTTPKDQGQDLQEDSQSRDALISRKPLRLTVAILFVVFLWETVVMFLFAVFMPTLPTWIVSLLDAFVLVVIVGPALYFFLYLPLSHHMAKRIQAEENLLKSQKILKQQVEERTGELVKVNEELLREIGERKRAEQQMQRTYQTQGILYELLQISIKDLALSEMFAQVIDLILSVPWLEVEKKGCIFLVEEGSLVMKAHRNLGEAVSTGCRRVPFGTCICGRAALSGEMEFADCIDERHDIRYEGMPPHGHYCVPILGNGKVSGVMCFYVQEGHQQDGEEEAFLRSVANALAGVIERKQAEEERARLAAAISAAAEAVIITDAKGTLQYVNPAFERISGYTLEESVGRSISMIESGQHDKDFLREMWHTVGRGDVWSGYFVNRKKDGAFYEVEATISPIRDSTGHTNHYVSVQRDVTHERRMEMELRQAQKMEAIGTLAGGIAHDFNNILAAIMGFTEIALSEIEEENGVRESLKEVLKASHRARDLVRQILAFSRKGEQEQRPISLHPLVKEVLKLLRASLPSTIEIHQNIRSDAGVVLADPTQMHQILMNLCTNAKHAMREKGGILEVNLQNEELKVKSEELGTKGEGLGVTPGRYVKLTVKDTGCGMAPEILERIFDPYFTIKEKGEGTGLGLSVVHGIVKSHGGVIDVQSELEKGSVFHIYFPVIEPAGEASAAEGKTESLPTGHERILFVDDEESLVKLGEAMLRQLGYKVVSSTGSQKALTLFRENPEAFDLVITDMTMPNMTGERFAGELMAIRPNIPVVLCTGFNENISEPTAKAMGIGAFLMKPYSMKDLAQVVRKVLD